MRCPRRFCGLAIGCVATLAATTAAAAPATKELGFNVHQSTTTGLDATVAAGVKWVRVDFNWLDAEPSAQGQYDWSRFDALVAAADAKGLRILGVVAYTPAWASQANRKGDALVASVAALRRRKVARASAEDHAAS